LICLYSRFEELVNAPSGKKRTADSMDEDAAASMDGLSKKQKKKLAKKLKTADGEGVAASVASVVSAVSVDASPDAKKKEKKEKKEHKKDEGGAAKGETQTLPGGLVIVDAKKGTGKAAKKGNQLCMRYIGKLENGKIFDKNTSGAPVRGYKPRWFPLILKNVSPVPFPPRTG
jgi:FK506-binding nuclear protein